MMFTPVTILAVLFWGLSAAPVDVSGGGAAAFPVEFSSFSAFMESLSTPLALRLAGWLVLGCGIGIGLSFLVRRRARAIVAGILGGLLASGGFLVMVQRLDEMAGHILAVSVLGLTMALMFALARRGTAKSKVRVEAPVAKSKSAVAPAPKAAAPSAPAPKAAPKPAPMAQSSSTSASDTDEEDEDESAPAAGASSSPPEDEAAPKATPKPSAPAAPKPAPMKQAPTQAKSAPGPSWMHD